jgi:hypothetical protein
VVLVGQGDHGSGTDFAVRAVLDTPYATMGIALGWTAGVPRAEARVHRMNEPYDEHYWHVAIADSAGLAAASGLLYGLHEVAVARPLTAAETVQVAGDAQVVAGGRRMYGPASGALDVGLTPDRRGSLVFSEFGFAKPSYLETGGRVYGEAKYLEVYNNAGTTVYLDGKYFGAGWDLNNDYPYWPCAQTAVVRNDPEGVWTERVFRFPGSGTDHPLAPGQVALIAVSAIDHRAVHPALYDLRQADFELGVASSADNPDVPNLEFVGLRPPVFDWPGWGIPLFLAEPVDLATLPRYIDPHSGTTWVRIPRVLVLDASATTVDWTTQSYEPLPACLEDMHAGFERLAGPAAAVSDVYEGLSAQRRILAVLPDGRKVLQDTNTSMVDFVKAARTPGWIP